MDKPGTRNRANKLKEEVLKLHQLYTTKELAEMLGIGIAYVSGIKKTLGIDNKTLKKASKEGYRICIYCKVEKPIDEFYFNSKASNRRRTYCKECDRVRKRLAEKENILESRKKGEKEFKKAHKHIKCPFCGEEDKVQNYTLSFAGNGRLMIECNKCGKIVSAKKYSNNK